MLDQRFSGPDESIGDVNLDLDNLTEWAGSPEALERLTEVVQLTDDDGRTVVHAAALGTNLDCLKLTLLAGGDPFSTDHGGRTPLHYAVASCAFASRNSRSSSLPNHLNDSSNSNESHSVIYRANAIADATNASLVFLKVCRNGASCFGHLDEEINLQPVFSISLLGESTCQRNGFSSSNVQFAIGNSRKHCLAPSSGLRHISSFYPAPLSWDANSWRTIARGISHPLNYLDYL